MMTANPKDLLVEEAVVVDITPTQLWVETAKTSVCGSCAAKQGCGQSLLARVGGSDMMRISVSLGDHSADDFSVGQTVQLAVQRHAVVLGSLLVYILPLLGLIAGVITGGLIETDVGMFIASVAGFATGAFVATRLAKSHENDERFTPILLTNRLDRPVLTE